MLVGVASVIFAATCWLYWPSVDGQFLTRMDDDEYLRQAVWLKGLNWDAVRWAFTTTQPYYHPLPRLAHVLDYEMWGTNPRGHHATNVLWHGLNAALVFGFLWTLLGAVSLTNGERLAMAGGIAVIFAIHPLQVESVAWISGRTQLMCAAFGIGCLWAYAAGARRWMVWTLFVAALLCKPMAVSLPFAMLAMDYFPLRRQASRRWTRLLGEKAVLIALGVAVSVVTLITESRAGGLMLPSQALRPLQRVYLAAQSLTFYPWKLVWPAALSPYYPLGLGFSLRPPLVLASVLFVAGITGLSIWWWRRAPALAAGWGAYVMLVLPVSGLIQTGEQAVAERYAYVAMLPLLLLAAGTVVWLCRRGATVGRLVLAGLLAGELFFFGLRTRADTQVWHGDETLWRGVLVQFPDSYLANEMLGQTLLRQARIAEGVGYAQRAVEISPHSAETHRNLGTALITAGRFQDAAGEFILALQIQPEFSEAHNNLGVALYKMGRPGDAILHWEEAIRINPNYTDAHLNLAAALERAGQSQEAIAHYEAALRIRPDVAAARKALARLRAAQ